LKIWKESCQEYHMIEVEGKINEKHISFLIDSRDRYSYIDPNIVEIFHLEISKYGKSWFF
jgi:hypothetical protein